MNDIVVVRRLARGSMFAAALAVAVPFGLVGVVGCGDSDKTGGTVVAPAPTIDSANKNMEDFMKNQPKGKKGGAPAK
jgi:hypothetical protein